MEAFGIQGQEEAHGSNKLVERRMVFDGASVRSFRPLDVFVTEAGSDNNVKKEEKDKDKGQEEEGDASDVPRLVEVKLRD